MKVGYITLITQVDGFTDLDVNVSRNTLATPAATASDGPQDH